MCFRIYGILTRNADQINCEMPSSPRKIEDYHTNVCKNSKKEKKKSKFSYVHKHSQTKSMFIKLVYLKAWFFILKSDGFCHHIEIAVHNYIVLEETFKTTYIVLKSGLPSNAPSGITDIELLWNNLKR